MATSERNHPSVLEPGRCWRAGRSGRAPSPLCEHAFVGSKGSAYAQFQRAIERNNLIEADSCARELGKLSLKDALDYCDLLARQAPERFELAALRWHGRWETEAKANSLHESQLALACLQLLTSSDRAIPLSVLRHLVKRADA
jgi:hypothetical protein